MKIYGRGFTLTIVFAVITFGLTFVAWSGSANQSVDPQEANKQQRVITPENDVPVLDFKQAEKTGSEQLKGRKRGQSLHRKREIAELPRGAEPLPSNVHAWLRMPALPIEQSNESSLARSQIAAQS